MKRTNFLFVTKVIKMPLNFIGLNKRNFGILKILHVAIGRKQVFLNVMYFWRYNEQANQANVNANGEEGVQAAPPEQVPSQGANTGTGNNEEGIGKYNEDIFSSLIQPLNR